MDSIMFERIFRCYYNLSNLAFIPNKQYKIPWWFYLDIFMLFYTLRLYGISYLMYINFKTLYNFKVYDPLVQYGHLNIEHYDAFMPVVMSLFVYFSFVSNYFLLFVNSNTKTWIFWYSLIVKSQDDYYLCKKV